MVKAGWIGTKADRRGDRKASEGFPKATDTKEACCEGCVERLLKSRYPLRSDAAWHGSRLFGGPEAPRREGLARSKEV